MSGSWLQHLGGCWVQGWCLWAGSLVPAWQLSGLLGPTLLGHTATLEAESQRSFSGPRTGRDSVSCVHWGSAHLSLCPRQLVCPSFWSLCVCILSSALPSLLAPPLVSSSLTYWQDEVPRLPPGAHSPRSAPPRGRGGVARCCLALWSSEQVDRHLLPRVALGVALGCRLLHPQRDSPLHMHGSQGCVKGQWPKQAGKPGPPTPY